MELNARHLKEAFRNKKISEKRGTIMLQDGRCVLTPYMNGYLLWNCGQRMMLLEIKTNW